MSAVESHLRFALALHRVVGGDGGNSCYSPYSVASALTLVLRGAGGETAKELEALLGEDQAALLKAGAELAAVSRGEQPEIGVSNTLWASDLLRLEDSFKAELVGWPGAGVASAPFESDPEAARAMINTGVGQATHGLIPELLPPGSITADTTAALVNALYLKAAWIHAFTKGATAPADFHAPGGTHQVPMMHLRQRVGYAQAGGWQAVQLAAAGGVQALVLLPSGDLAEAEAALDEHALAGLIDAIGPESLHLSLPKVALDLASDLTELLKGLGVRAMFGSADLRGLSPDPLKVSEVLHQAVLRVDEEGFDGAAATAVVMTRGGAMSPDDPIEVTVDRPFLLLVRHAESGAVHFFARVVEP